MKAIFKSTVLLVLWLAFGQLQAQCWLSELGKRTSGEAGQELADALLRDPKLIDSYKLAYQVFPDGSKFLSDVPTLQQISKMSDPASGFRTKLGDNWQSEMKQILEKTTDLKCSSCGSQGRAGRSSIEIYLKDVEYFVSNFNIGEGGKGKNFYNWMKGGGTDNQLDEVHQTIRDFANRNIKETDVVGLGQAFDVGKPDAAKKEYDLLLVNGNYTEYKNVAFDKNPLTSSSQSVDQFIDGYLRNIQSLDKMQWKVSFGKLEASWGSKANALTQMKQQWKAVFEARADEIFEVVWENQSGLKESLFSTTNKAGAKTEFLEMIEFQDDDLFKFIKVE